MPLNSILRTSRRNLAELFMGTSWADESDACIQHMFEKRQQLNDILDMNRIQTERTESELNMYRSREENVRIPRSPNSNVCRYMGLNLEVLKQRNMI